MRVNLAGKVSNRSGVGAKIEVRAGSLAQQKFETYSAAPAPAPADMIFGLGKRTKVDAVRVLWPAGIVQAETEIANIKSPITSQNWTANRPRVLICTFGTANVLCSSPISWVAARWAISMRRVFTTRRIRMSTCASAAICCGNAMGVTSCA